MEQFALKECYVKLEPLENLLSANDAASLALFTKESDSTIQTIRKFLISKVNFRRETQHQFKNQPGDNSKLSSGNATKSNKLHICHICFQSFSLNCDLRDHVFFAHTAHPTLQETLKVNIVGTEVGNELDYNEILSGHKEPFIEEGITDDANSDFIRKSGRRPVKNRRYDDYLAPGKSNKTTLPFIIKKEYIFTPGEEEAAHQSTVSPTEVSQDAEIQQPLEILAKEPAVTTYYTKSEPVESGQNSCNICGKLFNKRLHLKRHFDSVHLRLRPHLCYECGEKFASKDTLAQHIRTIHEKSRPFICTLCPGPNGKAFTRKQCLTTHIRVAHRDLILRQNNPNIEVIIIDPFNPENPNNPISSAGLVDENESQSCQPSAGETSTEYKERKNASYNGGKIKLRYYRCHFCGKIFNQEAHLSRHIKSVHERLKPYKCYLCAKIPIGPGTFSDHDSKVRDPNYMVKSFSRKEFLIKHIRSVHQGYRGYQCEDCGMKYCDKRDMENHRKKAHSAFQNPGATRSCPYESCGKVFTSRIHLSKHLKKFHPNHKNPGNINPTESQESSGIMPVEGQNELEAIMLSINSNGPSSIRADGLNEALGRYGQTRDNGNISFLDSVLATNPGMLTDERPVPGLSNYGGMISDMDHILTDINFNSMTSRDVNNLNNKDLDPSLMSNTQFSEAVMFDTEGGVTESDSPDAVFLCESCDKGFINRASLIRHFKSVHENHRAYTCHICGRSFNQKPHLERHLSSLIHADILKYPCDYCNKRFALKSQLEKHLFDLNYHRDPNFVRVPKYVCYICTPPEALAIGNELDFVADGEDPYAALASGGGQLKPSNASESTFEDVVGQQPNLLRSAPFTDLNNSSDEENDANDGILRVNSTYRQRNSGRLRTDPDDRLLATLTSTLDEGRITYDSGMGGNNNVAGISAVPAEPGSIRDQLHHIRQSSIVRFGRKKDLIKHLKEVHYGHIAFNQLGLNPSHPTGDLQNVHASVTNSQAGNSHLLLTQQQHQHQVAQAESPQLDTGNLITTSAYDAGQLTAILMREQQDAGHQSHGPISTEDELAQYCNELESAAAASDRLNAAAAATPVPSNYLIADSLTPDQSKMVAAVMGSLAPNGSAVYDVGGNNFVLINTSTGLATRVDSADLVDVCGGGAGGADVEAQLRCALEEHARRAVQESVMGAPAPSNNYDGHHSLRTALYPSEDAMTASENDAADDVLKSHPALGSLMVRNATALPGPLHIASSGSMGLGGTNIVGNTNSLIMSNLAALNNSLGAASQRAHLNTLQQQFSLNVSPNSISHLLNNEAGDYGRDPTVNYVVGGVNNLDPILAAASPSAPLPIYECKVCCRTFASKVNLRRHNERIHTDLKPSHLCEFCGKVFGYARTLRDHIHTAHREECRASSGSYDSYDINLTGPPGDDGGSGRHEAVQSSSSHHQLLYNSGEAGVSAHGAQDDDDDPEEGLHTHIDTLGAGHRDRQQLRVIYASGPEQHDGAGALFGNASRASLALMDGAPPSVQEMDY